MLYADLAEKVDVGDHFQSISSDLFSLNCRATRGSVCGAMSHDSGMASLNEMCGLVGQSE